MQRSRSARAVPAATSVASVDALLAASRALVAVAARSLVPVEDVVTLAQYRLLLVISMRPGVGVKELAAELRVQASTVTRMTDRLVAKELVRRATSARDRREVELTVTRAGQALVDGVTTRRRRELARAVERLDPTDRDALIPALTAFAEAVTSDDADALRLGWR